MTRDSLLQELQALYARLPPRPSGNPCGTCNACCRADLSHHRVSALELGLIEERVSLDVRRRFQAYIERERGADGELLFAVCPNYSDGCQIYTVRPFSCRTFGHYREEGTRLPEGCVFIGKEQVFSGRAYFQSIPESLPLRQLSREFQLFLRTPIARFEQTGGGTAVAADFLEEGDALDRALHLQSLGQLERALETALSCSESLYRDYSVALLCSMLDRHEEAFRRFADLCAQQPERAEFHYYAGYHAVFVGRIPDAMSALAEATRLEPEYAMAWGFLGYLQLQLGQWPEARASFAAARAADPTNPFFALRWAVCQRQLGESAGVAEALSFAALHPSTAEQAEALRA